MKMNNFKFQNLKLLNLIIIFIVSFGIFNIGIMPILAQETQYEMLAPLPISGVGAEGRISAGAYISGIFVLLIALAGVLAVVMLIIGGIRYMSTDAFTEKNEAKNTIQHALWGFLLAIGAWLILNTINPTIFNTAITASSAPITTPGGGGSGGGGGPIGGGGPSALTLTQQQAMDAFAAGGVAVVGGINLTGIRQGTVDEVIALRAACGCSVTVTSATGGEHASGACSHSNGYKADIRSTGTGVAAKNFIESTYQYIGTRSDGSRIYASPTGGLYAVESDHIDMSKCS